jgi:hypothetical protein
MMSIFMLTCTVHVNVVCPCLMQKGGLLSSLFGSLLQLFHSGMAQLASTFRQNLHLFANFVEGHGLSESALGGSSDFTCLGTATFAVPNNSCSASAKYRLALALCTSCSKSP